VAATDPALLQRLLRGEIDAAAYAATMRERDRAADLQRTTAALQSSGVDRRLIDAEVSRAQRAYRRSSEAARVRLAEARARQRIAAETKRERDVIAQAVATGRITPKEHRKRSRRTTRRARTQTARISVQAQAAISYVAAEDVGRSTQSAEAGEASSWDPVEMHQQVEAAIPDADRIWAPDWVYDAVYAAKPEEEWKGDRTEWFLEQIATGGRIPEGQLPALQEDLGRLLAEAYSGDPDPTTDPWIDTEPPSAGDPGDGFNLTEWFNNLLSSLIPTTTDPTPPTTDPTPPTTDPIPTTGDPMPMPQEPRPSAGSSLVRWLPLALVGVGAYALYQFVRR